MFTACKQVSLNAMEKKIEGTWSQTGGSGTISDLNLLLNYTFTEKKGFMQEAQTGSDGDVLYKQGFNQKGKFKIQNDSIYL